MPTWLEWAIALQRAAGRAVLGRGGWRLVQHDRPAIRRVLLRMKEDYDGAEPTASSVSVLNALTLAHLTGRPARAKRAERTLGRYGPRIGAAGRTIPMMLCALSGWHAGYSQVVVVGPLERAMPLRQELARHYLPFAVVIPVVPGSAQERSECRSSLVLLLPGSTSLDAAAHTRLRMATDVTGRDT